MTFHPREELDELRRLPLDSILLAAGAQPDRFDKARWHTAKGAISVTGMKFINWNQSIGGGGAIDLTMHVLGLSFVDAVKRLSAQVGSDGRPRS